MGKYHFLLKECNRYNINDFVCINFNKQVIGYVHKDNLEHISRPDIFKLKEHVLTLHSPSKEENILTHIFEDINHSLLSKGIFKNLQGTEMSKVVGNDFNHPLFFTKRNSIGFWGFRNFAVHLNGLVRGKNDWFMWVAKRADDRPAPGLYDHLVSGGVDANYTIEDNLTKEATEEASIPHHMLKFAVPVGAVSSVTQIDRHLNRFVSIIFDLLLPNEFEPSNLDGSIKSFSLVNLKSLVEDPDLINSFKVSCVPVLINLLIRYGYIRPNHPKYFQICSMLYHGLCNVDDRVRGRYNKRVM